MMAKFSGGCLCGAVRYESEMDPVVAGHCHCNDCRRSSGTGHCSHLGLPEPGFRVSGALRFYDAPADSGNIVSRGFCPTCGSPIYSTNSAMRGMIFLRASSLDDPEVFKPQMVVYTKRAPSWDAIAGGLPSFEAMPQHPG
ncbi:MAG: aldehyde-activating protein [Rhizobiales bacterium]|nr:aldehyde-activating protein [Hyphomicrobiales bacterium]